MLTCVIRYHIDPARRDAFETYARTWAEAIPRCGASLTGYYLPHEGSATLAYGIYDIESLKIVAERDATHGSANNAWMSRA